MRAADKDRPDDLLLDLGNVLVGVEPERTVAAFERLAGREIIEPGIGFAPLLDLNAGFDSGAIDAAGFRDAIRARLGIDDADDDMDRAWCAMLVELPHTARLVADLVRRHRLYMLSNTDPIHFEEVRRSCAGWLSHFSGLFLSFEQRLTKPDPAFFEAALAQLGLDPGRCLFLDDRAENVDAARAIGIQSHRVARGLDRAELVAWGLLSAG